MDNKPTYALIAIVIPLSIFASSFVTNAVSELNHDLKVHAELPCHTEACLNIEEIKRIVEEEHCINVAQIKQTDPLDCI